VNVRPTRTGALVLALAAALGGTGWALHYPELTLVGATLVAAVAAGAALAVTANRPATVVRRLRTDRFPEGEAAAGTVTLTNPRRRRRPPGTVVDVVAGVGGDVGSGVVQPIGLPAVGGGATGTTDLTLPPLPRGRYRLGPLTLVATDPLGLTRCRRRAGGTATMWVHPRVHPVHARRAPGGHQVGLHLRSPSAEGLDLHRLDQYTPGDDPRFIHWPTSLRRGTLMVRQPARDHQGDALVVVLDTATASYAGPEQFEHAVRVVASIVLALAQARESVGVATTGGRRLAVEASRRRRVQLLDELAGLRPRAGDDDLTGFVPRDGRQRPLVAVTGDQGTPEAAVVGHLSRHADGVTLLRVGPAGGLGQPRHRGAPAVAVIAAPTSAELVDAWQARTAR
jgi:uncharacterized protein (DUF58 family)